MRRGGVNCDERYRLHEMKKDKYMKGWNVGQPMTYSEIDRLIKMVKDEIKIRESEAI